MVTTTTKTLNYSITKGNNTNSVNATITSTPGFNTNYLGKIPGILKLLELALAITSLVLIACLRDPMRPRVRMLFADYKVNPTSPTTTPQPPATTPQPPATTTPLVPVEFHSTTYIVDKDTDQLWAQYPSFQLEVFLEGEVFFLCAHSVVISVLAIILISYLFHTTSAMIIPKATTLENVANALLALLLLAAGIVEIVLVVYWKNRLYYEHEHMNLATMDNQPMRLAAAILALLNFLLFIGSFILSRKELAGPKTL